MKRLPESEVEVMLKIWDAKEPICRFDLEKELAENQWASTTILTMLSRLEQKGFIQSEKIGKVKYYTPLVERDEYVARESQGFMEKFFGNSWKKFVVCMAKQEQLTDDEIEELSLFMEEQRAKHEEEVAKSQKEEK